MSRGPFTKFIAYRIKGRSVYWIRDQQHLPKQDDRTLSGCYYFHLLNVSFHFVVSWNIKQAADKRKMKTHRIIPVESQKN